MEYIIDMHMHTIYSDGSKTVKEVLEECEKMGLKVIAITDHNTCAAYYDKAYRESRKYFSGTIIRGTELNARFQNRSIEILGYHVNPDVIMKWREKYYSKEAVQRNVELISNRYFKILDDKGIKCDRKKIRLQETTERDCMRDIFEEILTYPENEKILGKEYFNLPELTFYRNEIANPNSDYFLDWVSTFPSAEEVVEIIHKAGGKAFFAHPFEYKFNDTMDYVESLVQTVNLDGIECYHPSAEDGNKIPILISYSKSKGLLISGGSDYHGELKPNIELGKGKGSLKIVTDILKNWEIDTINKRISSSRNDEEFLR